jgi:uncharacterized protein
MTLALRSASAFVLLWNAVLVLGVAQETPPEPSAASQSTYEQVAGNYKLPNGQDLAVNLFTGDNGKTTLLYTNYETGAVRQLSPVSGDEYSAGPASGVPSPVQLTFRFLKNADGTLQSVVLRQPDGRTEVARRMAVDAHDVSFTSGDLTLTGTLLVPSTKGPHPAIVLLHGSGPLPRWSFGPYPRFFASLGFAVLVYDKRTSGVPRTGFYPDVFLNDAMEAFHFLETRSDIDPKRIGLWGSSEGGMLGTQVAARIPNVAFVINSSGSMMPVWEQVLYNIDAQLRADGYAASEATDAVKFETLAIDVMRTGNRWDEYERAQSAALQTKWWPAYFGGGKGFSSLERIRWQWEHVYSFDPTLALRNVKCPVLGLFGALDTSTPAPVAAGNLEEGLRAAGNRDVTTRVFEHGNHPLMDARTGGNAEIPSLTRMVPGVFETLRVWLTSRMNNSPA